VIAHPRLKALGTALLLLCTCARHGFAQSPAAGQPITASIDAAFVGDDGEFFSDFRTGETFLGSWQKLNVDFGLGDHATLRLGVFALERNGSETRTELARPIVSLVLGTKRHRFIMGTLETGRREHGIGPDRTTQHGMLPLLSDEWLWFTRPLEAGVQWKTNTEYVQQDVWFDYQQVITPNHRELFNAGFTGKLQTSETAPIAFLYQFETVHHGGQQFELGHVTDSIGWGPGVLLRQRGLPLLGTLSLEAYALYSYDRPDREHPELTVWGNGVFTRVAAENAEWRAHGLYWHGQDFKHEEGDFNYLSLGYDSFYRKERDYFEMGLAKQYHPAPAVDFEASGRAHVIQGEWGYSFRLLGILHHDLGHWNTK
jgi:hypothetical protein